MKRKLLAVLLALTLTLLPTTGVFAATSQDVTVTATPSFIAISNAPATWLINGITGNGVIATDTVYYTNPLGDTTAPSATVVDGECRFTLTNTSTVNITLTVNFIDFTGGDAMANSDTGANGATTYGAYSWYSGMTYASKVIAKTTASSALKTDHPALTDLKWGVECETQTNAWTSGDNMTSTVTISAAAS